MNQRHSRSKLARFRPQPVTAKRAAVLLYGLQLASTNARSITIEPASSITRTLTRPKSGLDLAPRDNEAAHPPKRRTKPNRSRL